MMQKPIPDNTINNKENPMSLRTSKSAQTLISHNKTVVTYYQERNQKIVTCMSYVEGSQRTQSQLLEMARNNKAPVTFDYIKPSYRTILGMFTGNKYDIEFSPTEPSDDKVSDMLKAWYTYNAYKNDFQKHDLESLMNAWACGIAYVETYIHTTPGKRPVILCQTLNPLNIYMDPNSRDVGSRSDAQFIDRILWMSAEDLRLTFHKKNFDKLDTINNNGSYKTTPEHTDLDHETMDQKNNTFKVIERMYKVRIPQYFKFNDNMDKEPVSEESYKTMESDTKEEIYNEPQEMLYTAIVCPAWSTSEYIYNDEYSCQPRNARTQRIIFPIQEMVAESLNGHISGFVEHLISPQNLINAAMTQLYHQMQHATASSYAIDKSQFASDDEASRFAKDHTKADETFILKEGADVNAAIQVIPRGASVNQDNSVILNNALNAFRELSSTPMSLQGGTDSSTTSGIQNEQKIQQATTMTNGLNQNFKDMVRRRADIMLAYLVEYKDQFADELIRNVEEDKSPDAPEFMTMMETSPELDANGEWTGAMMRLNDPTTYDFDIRVTDSFYSPSQRAKIMQQLTQLISMGATANDPVMNSWLILEFLRNMDVPQETKQKVISHSSALQQQAQTENQGANSQVQLDQMRQMDQMSTDSANQAMLPPPTAPPQPGM